MGGYVTELKPPPASKHSPLKCPVDNRNHQPVAWESIVVVGDVLHVVCAHTLILLLPTIRQLDDIEPLTETITDELHFLLGLDVLFLGIKILFRAIARVVDRIKLLL